ncbi:unnamed protein product [Cunninghamella blakesleeana]
MKSCFFICILFIISSVVKANNEKIIFSDTSSCINIESITAPYTEATLLKHPYTSVHDSLISPTLYLYSLVNLIPKQKYEVRLSYPATVPTDIKFDLVCQDNKLYGVFIQGTYAGVSNYPNMESKPIPVEIVLEKLVFGVVHKDIYKVVVMILIAVVLGYFILIPRVKQFLEQAVKED